MAPPPLTKEFAVHEGPLTIDGTYTPSTDTVMISAVDIGSHDTSFSPPITLTGIAATVFVDLFHIGESP
jgi:hypothetical protein